MKKPAINLLGILSIASLSFGKNPQAGGLKKVGKNLYEVKSTAALNTADQEKFKNTLAKQYGIQSFAQSVTVHYTPVKGLKGNGVAMAEQKLSTSVFQQTVIEDGDEEVKQACIYEDCKGNASLSEVAQILSNYNIH